MFCDDCGKKIKKRDKFCDSCGASITGPSVLKTSFLQQFGKNFKNFYTKTYSFARHNLAIILIVSFVIIISIAGYKAYTQISQSLQEASKELQKTQNELSLLRKSTVEAIGTQQKTIDDQGQKITEKDNALNKSKADEALLQKTINNIQQKLSEIKESQVSNPISGGNVGMLNEFTPSVVSLYCSADRYSNMLNQGSGVLYSTSSNTSELGAYYVETNLHVVKTSDGSASKCLIVLYPNYKNTSTYILFESENYRFYKDDIDVAFIKPLIIANETLAGSLNDLSVFAHSELKTSLCDSINIGDRLSIMGYPGIGGNTLTVTGGIVSGFEFNGSVRYIKTDAKIEHGDSGGLAIADSGCVLGIPTYVSTGEMESIGRILDLNYLFTQVLK